ncbi:KEOPS complex subunit Pcc1 [Haloglomus irregulare]|jgi:hypothetical protein|uniref:KEOPS complex subunit Pcc1 n=1 Tax=Haloglomus irregulare TaxID=2234134 RepID=UPI0037434B5E
MTGPDDGAGDGLKRTTVRTRHDDPAVVAAAVRPDNTDAMRTTVGADDGYVLTRIERPTTGGLRSTVDDYVVNCRVAETVAAIARGEVPTGVDGGRADGGSVDTTASERTASRGRNDSDISTHDTHDI